MKATLKATASAAQYEHRVLLMQPGYTTTAGIPQSPFTAPVSEPMGRLGRDGNIWSSLPHLEL